MRESATARCRCWRSTSRVPRPTDNFSLKAPTGSDSASICITDPPRLPLDGFRHVNFTREYSVAIAQYPQYEYGSAGTSKDSNVRRDYQGERRGDSTELKREMAVSKRDLNRISFSAGKPLHAPQPDFGSRNSETLVVPIDPVYPPQQRVTRSTGMRSVQ